MLDLWCCLSIKGTKDDVVKRELCQILTVGTLTDDDMLTDSSPNYLLSIKEDILSKTYGICYVDTATGNFTVGTIHDDAHRTSFDTLVQQLQPKEILCEQGGLSKESTNILKSFGNPTINRLKVIKILSVCTNNYQPLVEFWDAQTTKDTIDQRKYFISKDNPDGTWPAALQQVADNPLAMSALGAVIWYLKEVILFSRY